MNKSVDDIVDELLPRHTAWAIHRFMKENGWTWGDNERSPTIIEIRNTVYRLVKFMPKEGSTVSTGGFTLSRVSDNVLELSFDICGTYTFESE